MRKYNSSFKTAFVSEAGSELRNNDYFAYVELDNLACYVIADGITDLRDAESAKEAIHAVVNEFQAGPSMSKRALKSYLRAANRELVNRKSYEKLKASITVMVTNYEKMRYAYAGNTRLRLYRNGRRMYSSIDMSLSQDLVTAEKISQDALIRHEERNNLYGYLGMEHLDPFVSPRIKLKDTDIITLYTRGIWENIDEGELEEVFGDAGNDPQECCDSVEDMLISRQPQQIENYTLAAIFVDKIFTDPKRKKRIKKIVIISIIAFVVILVIVIVIIVILNIRQNKRDEMDLNYQNMMEYIESNNFIRAEEECEAAEELAKDLRDKEMRERLADYRKVLEELIRADGIYEEEKYLEAEDVYLSAKVRSRYADNMGEEYIDKKLTQINRYRDVYDNIAIGDKLLELDEYGMAEEKYIAAKKDAAFIYFESGKEQALAALETLYEEWAAANEKADAAAAGLAADQISAAELVKQGDEVYAEGDYDGAMVFYLIALEKYTELGDETQTALLDQKIIALNDKQNEVEERVTEAKLFEEQARLFTEEGQYDQAKEQYQYAKNIYQELGQDNRSDEMQGKIDVVDTKGKQQEKEQEAAAAESVSGNGG